MYLHPACYAYRQTRRRSLLACARARIPTRCGSIAHGLTHGLRQRCLTRCSSESTTPCVCASECRAIQPQRFIQHRPLLSGPMQARALSAAAAAARRAGGARGIRSAAGQGRRGHTCVLRRPCCGTPFFAPPRAANAPRPSKSSRIGAVQLIAGASAAAAAACGTVALAGPSETVGAAAGPISPRSPRPQSPAPLQRPIPRSCSRCCRAEGGHGQQARQGGG